jgi:sec-independent protein translocase protein TatA
MGGLSPIHWLLAIAVAGVVFGGRGKLSSIMGDAAKGIRAFKDGLKDEDHPAAPVAPPTQIAAAPPSAQPLAAEREEVRR